MKYLLSKSYVDSDANKFGLDMIEAVKDPEAKEIIRKMIKIEMDNLMREFYDTVGWDLATGGPTPEKLKALEIDQIV